MQKHAKDMAILFVVGLLSASGPVAFAQPNPGPTPAAVFDPDANVAAILKVMEATADWALANPAQANPSKRKPTDWTLGTFYAGTMALGGISTNQTYLDAMRRMGETNQWQLGARKYHADDQCVGQTYAELYFHYHNKNMIAPMQERFNDILAHPSGVPTMDFAQPDKKAQELWSWCDSLFMATPAWVRLCGGDG